MFFCLGNYRNCFQYHEFVTMQWLDFFTFFIIYFFVFCVWTLTIDNEAHISLFYIKSCLWSFSLIYKSNYCRIRNKKKESITPNFHYYVKSHCIPYPLGRVTSLKASYVPLSGQITYWETNSSRGLIQYLIRLFVSENDITKVPYGSCWYLTEKYYKSCAIDFCIFMSISDIFF